MHYNSLVGAETKITIDRTIYAFHHISTQLNYLKNIALEELDDNGLHEVHMQLGALSLFAISGQEALQDSFEQHHRELNELNNQLSQYDCQGVVNKKEPATED